MARHPKAESPVDDQPLSEETPRSKRRPPRRPVKADQASVEVAAPAPAEVRSPDRPLVERLKPRHPGADFEEEARRHPTLLIRRTLRSGQRVRFEGNVVVLGDVNPGAEITAGGDIIVMGWLRGLAHAGADGNEHAVVSAFRLNPTQLRIAQFIGRAPDQWDNTLPNVPEFAEVRDGQLVIDRWQQSVLGQLGR